MTIKATYESRDEIPESVDFRDLFVERDGKFELTGINGMRTQADVDRLNDALRKERDLHAGVKEKLKPWDGMDAEEIRAKLDRMEELEAAAKDKLDDAKIDEIVERRVAGVLKTKVGPLERQLKTISEERDQLKGTVGEWESKDRSRNIREDLRRAAVEAKVRPEAIDDVLDIGERLHERTEDGKTITRDGVGITPGLDPAGWLSEIQDKRPHWWGDTVGAGVGGGGRGGGGGFGGKNPWSHEHWNMTEQAKIFREKGPEHAEKLAKAAGTTVGGQRPAPKK